MPDKSTYSKRAHPGKVPVGRGSRRVPIARRSGYAELQCHTNFSFLRGASHPEELVERASALGYDAIAITDRHTLAGAVRMHGAAKSCGIKLVIGAEIIPEDAPPLWLYAMNRTGYAHLCRIITQGRLRCEKGACRVTFDDIAGHTDGLLGVTDARALLDGAGRREALDAYRDLFGDRLYLSIGMHAEPDDAEVLARAVRLSRDTRIELIATNDVHYHEPERRFLQDVLTCIRDRCTLSAVGTRLFANAERHLKSVDEITRLFADASGIVARTATLADRCTFTLDELRYEYPESLSPPDQTPHEYLAQLTWRGARRRYPQGVPDAVRGLIDHELQLIRELSYEPYFLTVWDIVKFARSRKILCQGRGSAANSVVCFCLGITSVDPDRIELLFERFVSAERNEPPDIDVDFEHERREEVFRYVYGKYGREHAGIVAEVITYRPRSAIRDVGKVLGLSLDRVAALAKKHEWWDQDALPADFLRETGLDPGDRTVRMLAKLVRQIVGFPRHLSQHVGGFVITRGPLCEMVPLHNGAMPGRTFIEWDKDDIDALGILKIDCLSLGMLTAIRKCFAMVSGGDRPLLTLATTPAEDRGVYDMICRADTVGVFQIESRAQMSMLPRLRPRCFYDLVIEVAIVRPGPIQGGMVHPYLRRRSGQERVRYPSDAVRNVLERTLGVPLFQEQAMRLAVVAAGFTPGEADQLRRAMGAWRRNGDIAGFQKKLIEGMRDHGLSQEFAEQCFRQICGFGEYGFPESHAASFALLVYVSAWLKRYHPAGFGAAILNSLPMGFYQPAQLVRDAREHGVTVEPIDVNHSGYDCHLEEGDGGSKRRRNDDPESWGVGGPSLRLGMRLIKGLSRDAVAGVERARGDQVFTSVADLARRSGVARATLFRLASADAMRSLGLDRRQAVWEVLALGEDPEMFEAYEPIEATPALPEMSLTETVREDYVSTGLSLHAHPMSLIRADLAALGAEPTRFLKHARHGQLATVAGMVLVRQRPSTASGVVFCTLEDETGIANLIIRPQFYEKYRRTARGAAVLLATGRVERQGEVIHLNVTHLSDASRKAPVRAPSRDFH